MTAPVCPINNSQIPYQRSLTHGLAQPQAAPRLPSIPPASDLPSLIRTVNVMRDVLRSLTTSLTVNNVFNPRPPFFKAQGDTYLPEFPEWDQKFLDVSKGYVYHKDKEAEGGMDKTQRAYIQRIDGVTFQNRMQEEADFRWAYYKALDSQLGQPILDESGLIEGFVGAPESELG
jgi:hypothetical protein